MGLFHRRKCRIVLCVLTFSAIFCECAHAIPSFTEFTFLLEPSNLVVSRGDAATLHCTAQSDSRSPSVTWIKDGQPLDLDANKNVWSNGTLHITNVQNSDRGLYQCMSSLPNLGTIISRTASLRTAYLSRNFLIQPQDLTIYLQDVAMFQCRGDGLPAPNVTWYKDNSVLRDVKSNIRIYQDGVLEINPVEFADFGTYYCQVENIERGRSSRLAKLEQNGNIEPLKEGMAPSFVITPTDTKIQEGSSTVLFCGANGRDHLGKQPVITWLKDGLTIDFTLTQGRLQMTGAGSLQIFNVQKSDAGTYSCRPSNMEDSIDSEATLTVQVPPKFLVKPKSRMAEEKTDAIFRCELDGSPTPGIYWTKDGSAIVTSDYVIEDGNELRILGLIPSDSGFYQCHGSNELGSIQAVTQLIVLPNGPVSSSESYQYLDPYSGNGGNLPKEPSDLSAAIISKRFITLRWNQQSSREVTGYSVFWKEQGSTRERMLNTTHTEANIPRLKPDTTYQFRVRAVNSHGFSSNFARTTVRTDKDVAVPSPAVSVRAVPQSPHSILVSWAPPLQPKGQITKYLLIFSEADSSHTSQIEVTDTKKLLRGLMAFREYTFHIVAVNENGEGMSTREISAKTFSDKPSEPPQNATLETASSTSLIVRWDPPPPDHQNGIITGYKIRYKKRGASRNGATVTTDGNRRLYALTNLEKDTEYQVRISALTVNGSGPLTPKMWATTYKDDLDESKVPDAPRRVHVTSDDTSIRVSWSTPPPESKIMVRGYILGWGKGVPDTEKKHFGPDTHVFTIKNLLPSSEYVITVKAKNNKGEGPPRYTTATTTKESVHESVVPLMPPVGLKTHVLSPTTIVLTWSDTTLGVNQMVQDNRYYTVRYRVATNVESENSRYWYLNSTDLNAHIDSLRPNTRYEFDVKVIKGRRQSPWSMKETNKTQEAAPGSPPLDLTPVPKENDPRAVIMNWQPPAKPNGQITGYLVFYTTDAKQELREWVVDGVLEGDELSATIKRLTPSTTYYFKVQARNSKGYGPLSETVIYKTPKADGSGGGQINPEYPRRIDGKIPTHDNIPQSPKPEDSGNNDGRRGGNSEGGLPTGIMNIIIASVVGATFCIIIIVVAVIYCKRRDNEQRLKRQAQQNQQSPLKGKGQGRDLKPPDLWIHDNMEMKNIDKGQRSESTLTMSTTRRSSNDYRSMDDLPPYHEERNEMYYHPPSDHEERERFLPPRQPGPGIIRPKATKPLMISVDAQPPPREPIAMVTALPNGALTTGMDRGEPGMLPRPGFPRTQYNMQYTSGGPRVNAGDLPQPPPIQAFPVEYAYKRPAFDDDDSSSLHSCHDDHSFSSRSIGYVKPQQSPYKKAGPPLSAVPVKPRAIPVIKPKAPDVVLKAGTDPDIQKSESTEELSAEMANLDCLMKDLNAITQQNFEV